MRQWTGSSLNQIMACRSLSIHYLDQCWHIVKQKTEYISMKFYLKFKIFHSTKCLLKMSSRKWRPFCFALNVLSWVIYHSLASELTAVATEAGMTDDISHWGRVTHICVSKLTIIGSDNGLSPDRRQAIIWTNAGLLLTGPLRKYFSENLIKIQ